MSEPPGLTPAERRVWHAFPTGAEVVFGDDRPPGPDPDRTVRAHVINQLLLGGGETRDGFVAAVRIRGAYVIGQIELSGGVVRHELRLRFCRLVEPPFITNCRTSTLRFTDCLLPGLDAGGLHADGTLSLSRSVVEGEIRLPRAQLLGGFRLNDAVVTETEPERWALFSGGMTVENGFFARHATLTGGVRLVGARMNGGLFMEGSTLSNPGRIALDGENMVVQDAAELSRGFSAEGTVRLRNARINGTLSFDAAVLDSTDPGRLALHGSHMTADELLMNLAEPIKGRLSLSYSRIDVLMDRPRIWPEEIYLDGLVYQTLRGPATPKDRLSWVSRDPQFHLQPYEQLAAWYHGIGHDDVARKVQLAKLRARRRRLGPVGRAWNIVLDWTVGFGYRPWLAFAWFAALVGVGTTVFSAVHPHPIKDDVELPHFHALVYSLDLLIPLDSFGLQSSYDAVGWTRWVAYTLITAGWVLATALIAGVTRVLRPE
ncbi:hypothetical protein DZF91_00995 [Actinomadura logoneensis]|uniref:Oxidoreductase n=1 Tax=Actinomadura logoneensis TaxID=2293572 RepID=A0A372JVW3_9ACTN|nr:hypothetical protein [Actinomadura logoneensis]RFU43478.1 hypothetical protein DZF91_00995 [Actinomadura logoneensis]